MNSATAAAPIHQRAQPPLMTSFSRCRSATRPGSVSVRSGRCSSAVTMLSSSRKSSESGGRRFLERIQARAEDQCGSVRGSERQQRLVIPQEERPLAIFQLQLARFEDLPVLIAEDGQEDAVPQFLLDGPPIDVEVGGVRRGGAVLQHVVPPEVFGRAWRSCGWARCPGSGPSRGRARPRPSPDNRSRRPTRGSIARNRRWHSRAGFPARAFK